MDRQPKLEHSSVSCDKKLTLKNAQRLPETGDYFVKYAIGSGKIGTALARNFTLVGELGPGVRLQSIEDVNEADTVVAVPFRAHKHLAKQPYHRNGKIVTGLTNAIHVAPQELGGLLSSEVVSQAFVGARGVRAFDHPTAAQLGTNPSLERQRQVVFVFEHNDAEACATVAAGATQLGFALVEVGRLDNGGVLLHFLGGQPGGLMFQNLVRLGIAAVT
jgi:predicted dinucleotide-binding enzyme